MKRDDDAMRACGPDPHPILVLNLKPFSHWNEWLKRLRAAEDPYRVEELLHNGFKMQTGYYQYGEPTYDEIDRLITYFRAADGWRQYNMMQRPDDERGGYITGFTNIGSATHETMSQIRQRLAKKALDMLCLNFFKLELKDQFDGKLRGEWVQIVTSKRLLPILQWFFRFDKDGDMPNFRTGGFGGVLDRPSHQEETILEFLLNLNEFLWRWESPPDWGLSGTREEEERAAYIAFQARLDAAKPWMIEVLTALKKLDVLEKWVGAFDEACVAKLRELALKNRLNAHLNPVSQERAVTTIDEACYLGSPAGWLLKRHELVKKEGDRLHTIREAELAVENAQRTVAELTSTTA